MAPAAHSTGSLPKPEDLPPPSPAHKSRKNALASIGPFGRIRMTLLIKACAEGDLNAVLHAAKDMPPSALLKDRDDWAGSSALHWAAYSGHAGIVQLLLERLADPRLPNLRDRALPVRPRANRSQHACFARGSVREGRRPLTLRPRANHTQHACFARGSVREGRRPLTQAGAQALPPPAPETALPHPALAAAPSSTVQHHHRRDRAPRDVCT